MFPMKTFLAALVLCFAAQLCALAQGGTPCTPDSTRIECLAERGDIQAQVQLGLAAYDAARSSGDYRDAVIWIHRAAEGGHVAAQYWMGFLIWYGKTGDIDPVEAYMWFDIAAAAGHETAMESRKQVSPYLTPELIELATALSLQWRESR